MKPLDVALLVGVFLLSYKGTQKVMSTVRGIRNNNWLNIKYNQANAWNGQTGKDDKGFSVFSDPVYSIRAGFKLLKNYRSKGIKTLEQMISRFAPATENKTANYISFVASKAGIDPTKPMTDEDILKAMPWMVKMEVGQLPDPVMVAKAWSMSV